MNTEEALDKLSWAGSNGWVRASRGVWLVDKQPVAYLRSHQNLASLLGQYISICALTVI